MWNRIELNPKEGLFLMKNGLYICPDKNITSEVKDRIIGYCLNNSMIISINASENPSYFSLRNDKIPGLTDYESDEDSYEPYKDIDGKYNTNCIVDYCRKNNIDLQTNYPATYYCTKYNPGFKDEEWYLPGLGELKLFYDNREKFRGLCKLIGLETNMNLDNSGPYYFWSSTEHSNNYSWSLSFGYSPNPSYWGCKAIYDLYIIPFLSL